ncbi:MAG: hypothetical protein GY787_33700 [Alteromonadales bacterium]|nr:hypothetical protein [Alteromonadales bacterium]
MKGQYPFNDNVLYTTHTGGGEVSIAPIAIAGSQTFNSGRYLAFGGSPFRTSNDEQMNQFLLNALSWLSNKEVATVSNVNIVISQLDESYYFKDASKTRTWLDEKLSGRITYNAQGECNGIKLATCIESKPDVVIISRKVFTGDDTDAILNAVEMALTQDIPILYIQHDGGIGDHGRALLNLFNISHESDNYWSKRVLTEFDPQTVNNQLPVATQAIKTLLTNFKNQQFNVDLSECDTRSCPVESNTQGEFFEGAAAIRSYFLDHDVNKRDIFQTEKYRLQKLLILLSDKLRQNVSYPMDKLTTDTNSFFKSLYSDYVLYHFRDINPVQPDMGNFSRSDFSHITPENLTVNMTTKPNFRSAGVYALPGQTFTVTRTDSNAVSTHIFVNSLRSGATHIFSTNKYNRPHLLQTQRIEVTPGETIKFTSSYGGPIQVYFTEKDIPISLEFTNIGRHAHWSSSQDDEIFAQRLQDFDYDWAEIATPGFEVHSKTTKLQSSLANSIWPVASDFANATERYTHNNVHVLAGFQGPGIDVIPEVHDFVTARGLSVDTIDIVKHMNADQPTCGGGCSGNPYDAGWNFSPTGHGDIHELGHGIERASMRFEGYGGHSNTNFYSYFTKSIYADDTGEDPSCQALPFESTFTTLQASKHSDVSDPIAYMQENLDKGWSTHHLLYIQLMMAAQAEGTLQNGWYLYPRMHIWDREMWRLDNSDESWLTGKVSLGFEDYTRAEFGAMSTNERLFISLSEISQLDLTEWFNMYGFSLTDKAIAQVKSKNHKVLDPIFYKSADYCLSLDATPVMVVDRDGDGVVDDYDIFPDDPTESSDADGDGIGDNQDTRYTLVPEDLTYTNIELKSARNEECLSINADATLLGQKIVSATCSNDANTLWHWGKDNQLHTDADPGLCISVSSLNNGAQLTLATCTNSNQQSWSYNSESKSIASQSATSLAFDLYSNKEVHLYNVHNGSNQQWTIVTH